MPPPAGYADESPLYSVEIGAPLAVPAKVAVPFQNDQNTVPKELSIYQSTDGGSTWVRIADSYINAGFLEGSLASPGLVFAGYPQTGACGG